MICMRAKARNRIGVDACVGVARIDAYSIWGVSAHADQCVRVCVCVCVGGVWSSGRWVVGWGRAWWWWRWEEGVVGVGAGVGVGGRWLGRVSGVACVLVWGVAVRWWGW